MASARSNLANSCFCRSASLRLKARSPWRALSRRGARPPSLWLEREYAGWLPNFEAPEAFARFSVTVHVPRRPYVEMLRGIPTIRPFEAMACGIPLVCSPWDDAEGLFRPGNDYLIAHNGAEMTQHLRDVLDDLDLSAALARSGHETIQARHTCAHRVDELLDICRDLTQAQPLAAGGPLMAGLNISFYGSSLVSAYWNGAATYYRGIIRALAARGHKVTFFEPDAWERQQHRDIADPGWARVVVYPDDEASARKALERAAMPMSSSRRAASACSTACWKRECWRSGVPTPR